MIQALRRRHRWMMVAITIVLPIVFAAGLAVRKPIPATENTLSALMTPSAISFSHLLFEKSDLWVDLKITTRVYADQQPAARLAVELHPQNYLKIPDLLVYWHSRSSILTDNIFLPIRCIFSLTLVIHCNTIYTKGFL